MLPTLFQSYGITIYSYALIMGIAWGLAYRITEGLITEQIQPFFKKFFLGLFVSAWVGGKLLYLMTTTAGATFQTNPNFWFGGGFVFYGGLIVSLLFTLLTMRLTKINILPYLVPGLLIGHGIGRIGCLLAGCCFGIKYEGIGAILINQQSRFPVQAIEAGVLIIMGIYFFKKFRPQIVFHYLMIYPAIRFFLEFLRNDEVRGTYWGISSSQILSLLIFSVSLIVWIRTKATIANA